MRRILFYKKHFSWPRSSGHDVHTYNMMRAMSRIGVDVGVVTRDAPATGALDGIDFRLVERTGSEGPGDRLVAPSRMEERFRSYWGVETSHVERFGRVARDFGADAVVVSGLDALPMLLGISSGIRVWYAADEWLLHHLSQVRLADPASFAEVRPGLIKAVYERTYRRRIDRAWVVTEADARAMRLVGGITHVDLLPNGVDAAWYEMSEEPGTPDTAVFWGRLDFGPNVQALEWFCHRVWPLVRRARPDAVFTIIGFQPESRVLELSELPGIALLADVPDIRAEVPKHALVVLPFVSGAGIKNKLLEAAAMGRAVVGTPRASLGLVGNPPVATAATAEGLAADIVRLWGDAPARRQMGRQARDWVVEHHTWAAVAQAALAKMAAGPGRSSAVDAGGRRIR